MQRRGWFFGQEDQRSRYDQPRSALAVCHTLDHLKGLAGVRSPYAEEQVSMYTVWRKRDHSDPRHRWLREKIRQAAEALSALDSDLALPG